MRAAVLLAPFLLLTACKDEPRFEDRYDKAAKEIEARAKAMDADITKADEAAATASGLSGPAKSSNPPPSSGE